MPRTNDDEHTQSPLPESDATGQDAAEEATKPRVDRRAPYQPKDVPLWNNFITIVGMCLAATGVMLLLTFGAFSLVVSQKNPYVDIVGFLVLPGILIIGLLVIPFGILFKSWRIHRRDPEQHLAFRLPRFDLNDPKQRRVAKIALLCSLVFLPLVGISSYHGYHYTDSASFCSKACHAAMHPQATAFENSAHARVACAECHIGTGAGWFVKSKLSGTRQVLAMWQNSYPRPIPAAITDLRPARETCEQCHWPRKFFGAQLREIVHYASDEANTRREINMLLKTGGGDETTGRSSGIHKHMALRGMVKYVATDDKLQVIPWVEFTEPSGRVLTYRSDGRPTSDPRPDGIERTLDCMDCHNRPAHKFHSPQEAVDIHLEIGRTDSTHEARIDHTLPFIKREAMKVLSQSYPDVETANAEIGTSISEFYHLNYSKVWETRRPSVNRAIDIIRLVYRQNAFADMKVDWKTYPDNIGHMISPGCFRCHDGSHVNQYGERLSHKCGICHTFLNMVEPGQQDTMTVQEGEFVHPYALQGPHVEMRCDWCHTGGIAPVADCAGCHTESAALAAGHSAAFEEFSIEPDAMADSVGCEDCHDLSGPTGTEAIKRLCVDCHDEEYGDILETRKRELDGLLAEVEKSCDAEGRRVLDALRRAGPLHNVEASRMILRSLTKGPASELPQPSSSTTEPSHP